MLVLCPSRGRPASLGRLVGHCEATEARARFLVRLDLDDPTLPDYVRIRYPANWHVVIGPRARPAAAMRECFAWFRQEDHYMLLGDDEVPRTPHWDAELAATAGGDGIAFPNDLIWHGEHCAQPCVAGPLLRALDFWTLPDLTHLYVDTVLDHVGRELGCLRYRPDVVIEHLHWSTGKSQPDETYRRVDNRKDAACFEKWKASPETTRLLDRARSIAA